MELIGWTYFSKRVVGNPTYYGVHKGEEAETISRLVDDWFRGSADEYGALPSIHAPGRPEGTSRSGTATGSGRSRSGSATTAITKDTGTTNGTRETEDTEITEGAGGVDVWAGGAGDGNVGGWGVAATPGDGNE